MSRDSRRPWVQSPPEAPPYVYADTPERDALTNMDTTEYRSISKILLFYLIIYMLRIILISYPAIFMKYGEEGSGNYRNKEWSSGNWLDSSIYLFEASAGVSC